MRTQYQIVTTVVLTIILLAIGIFAFAIIAQSASAQSQDDEQMNQTIYQTIDEDTRVLSMEYDDGTTVLQIESDIPQLITITDAGSLYEGGTIPREQTHVDPGDTAVIRIPSNEVDGQVGVAIDTKNDFVGVILNTDDALIGGPWTKNDVRLSAIAGLLGGLLIVGTVAYRRVHGSNHDQERVL